MADDTARPPLTPTPDDCAREPIHLSGAIQPHGYLLSCTPGAWLVRHASDNIHELLEVSADALLGRSLRDYVQEEVLHQVADTLAAHQPGQSAQRSGTANVGPLGTLCDLTVHASDGLVQIEIEPQRRRSDAQPTAMAQAMIARVAVASAQADFFRVAAEQVRELTGFDRVMVYRFRHDDSGEVIAEARAGDLESYLGLRYPATDIPAQARALYLRNRLRAIPDVGYAPVPVRSLDPADRPDLSHHVLRSVSPVHIEYLHNMGVGASMSISLVDGGRLWGLIACHHRAPRHVSPGVRTAAELFGLFVSMRITAEEQEAVLAQIERSQQLRDALAMRLGAVDDFHEALAGELDLLRDMLGADGAALWHGGRWQAVGRTPPRGSHDDLLAWLGARQRPAIAASDDVAEWAPVATRRAPGVAGVLAIHLGLGDDWLFAFRDEQVEDVRWAGEPAKAVEVRDGGLRLGPRRSFAEWRETVRGRSLPWTDRDRRGAERILRLVREQRRRRLHVEGADALRELDQRQTRQSLHDHRQRLLHLSALVEGLAHIDAGAVQRLEHQIVSLEQELRGLIHAARPVAAA